MQPIIPSTDRTAAGSNWEKFKSLIKDSTKSNDENAHANCPKRKQRKGLKLDLETKQPPSTRNHERREEKVMRGVTKYLGMDCEMVGIGDGTDSMVARVSIVNQHGHCLYDKYVKPRERVSDYRTAVSGIRPDHLKQGEEFEVVQKEVAALIKGKIIVGHALKNDFDVLFLSHPRSMIRDTSRYKGFREGLKGRGTPGLKKLASTYLGKQIQTGEHNSVEDARTAMQLYMLYKNVWESQIHSKR